jgi:hypothetical protein
MREEEPLNGDMVAQHKSYGSLEGVQLCVCSHHHFGDCDLIECCSLRHKFYFGYLVKECNSVSL